MELSLLNQLEKTEEQSKVKAFFLKSEGLGHDETKELSAIYQE